MEFFSEGGKTQWEVLVVYDTNMSSTIQIPLFFKQKWQLDVDIIFSPVFRKIPKQEFIDMEDMWSL